MTVLSAQSIRRLANEGLIVPFCERSVANGMSYGLSGAGYDIRVRDKVIFGAGPVTLAASLERLIMPDQVIGFVKDKSSWARRGLFVQNTVIEPGWEGWLTLELTYHGHTEAVRLEAGTPIAQVVFQWLDDTTEQPYSGKYQNQGAIPTSAIMEEGE